MKWIPILTLSSACLAMIPWSMPAVAQDFPLKIEKNKLIYSTDEQGNRILDYSSCGYQGSDMPIPDVDNVIYVPWQEGDNAYRIQRAINHVASLPCDANGFRGAVLLGRGTFELESGLRIPASGIVLRGADKEGTVLLRKGVDRGAVIYVEGQNNMKTGDTLRVAASPYIPVNETTLHLTSSCALQAGDGVQVLRPSTQEWIASMGCDVFGGGISALGWKPGDNNLVWDRTVVSANGAVLTLDAPLTHALDAQWGTAFVIPYIWTGRIEQVGIEHLTLQSDYDTRYPMDEDHCWTGISMEHARNCWVRQVNFKHFAGSAVILQRTASKITVEDCVSTEPVSEIGGMRRRTFFTLGQQTLFQRCYAEHGIHDFSAGFCAAGPNAFVQCDATEPYSYSGSIDAWACGLLFDIVNIDGNDLKFTNLGQEKNGAGWNTGNSLFWQCTAAEIFCSAANASSMNRAYGCWGQFEGNGQWKESNNHVSPRSFFYAQLADRLGSNFDARARLLPTPTSASSSPTVEVALQLTQAAEKPRTTLRQWIDEAPFTASTQSDGLLSINKLRPMMRVKEKRPFEFLGIADGRLVVDGRLLVGGRQETPWWNGKLKPNWLPQAKVHVTRFVPGQEGRGLTDRIDSTVSYMKQHHLLVLDHNYGLWTDRRRDDHERIRRRDGDVWGPFYEQPFARSGEGKAWDGLSLYDLNRPNAWYWSRLQEFATKGLKQGLLLFHENYFQHNIIEAGAHWVDCPWRTANNINATGFPEPVPFAGDKRIFMAQQFYDVEQPERRALHRQYIRLCLDAFADQPNVVQLLSAEYTGPLHFLQFWLDVIAEWEQETGKHALVALSATKDVQDAILSDAKRAQVVDIIDIRYWHYKTDGIYAPEGGKNLAPRQHARRMKVGKVTFKEAYKAVSEYRTMYPSKAVTYYAQNYPDMAWAVFMASGSCPDIPPTDAAFLKAAASMHIVATPSADFQMLGNDAGEAIIYSHANAPLSIALPKGKYSIKTINRNTGEVNTLTEWTESNGTLQWQGKKDGIYWVACGDAKTKKRQ